MATVALVSSRPVAAARVVARSGQADLGAGSLQHPDPGIVWRSTSAAMQWVDVQFAWPQTVDAVALVWPNLTAAARLRLVGACSVPDLDQGPAWDGGWRSAWPASGKPSSVDRYGLIAQLWPMDWIAPPPRALPAWRLWIDDPGNPAGWLEAGGLVMGPAFEPTRNFAYGATIGLAPADVQVAGAFGGVETEARLRPRVVDLTLPALEQGEALGQALALDRAIGLADPVLLCLDRDADAELADLTMYGVLTATDPMAVRMHRRWSKRYRVREKV